MDDVMQTNICR